MEKKFESLKRCVLFENIGDGHLPALLKCLSAGERTYEKGAYVMIEGEPATHMGVVLSGSVNVVREDFWGNREIIAHIPPGGLFAEAFCAAGVKAMPVSVEAAQEVCVLLMDFRKVVTPCRNACPFHGSLIAGMVRVLAQKNVALTRKLDHVTRRTTREKLLSYLSDEAARAGGGEFAIPFDRQELADYLAVERSAMSAQLSALRREGVLRAHKNRFELLRPGGDD